MVLVRYVVDLYVDDFLVVVVLFYVDVDVVVVVFEGLVLVVVGYVCVVVE